MLFLRKWARVFCRKQIDALESKLTSLEQSKSEYRVQAEANLSDLALALEEVTNELGATTDRLMGAYDDKKVASEVSLYRECAHTVWWP